MLAYHGTPITPEADAAKILRGRHALVSFAHPEQIKTVASVCASFVLDNGAFSAWKKGQPLDCEGYYAWVDEWRYHPGFDWAIIPDVIDGDEDANDRLLVEWPFALDFTCVPVWHLHESLDRLERLCRSYSRIALGSSGQYATVKSPLWWARMAEAMEVLCDEYGRPRVKIHGLRMLDPDVFTRFPFAGADSSNIGQNVGKDKKWPQSVYQPASQAVRGLVIADRIESHNSAERWHLSPVQAAMDLPDFELVAQ